MADGRKIPYLIELAADDKKIRQQMAKLNWEELLGSNGKGFGDVLVSDAKEAKDQIKRTLGGLDIDWSKILGAKEIGQLEQAVAKALSKSRKEIELFAASGDTSGLERTIKYVSALGDELKGLGSNFDAAALARGMNAFMKVLTPLTAKFEALADEPKKVEAAFDRLFSGKITNDVAKVSEGFTIIGDAAGRAAVKANKSIETMEAKLASIDAMLSKDYGKNFKFETDLEGQFYSIDEAIEGVEENIEQLSQKLNKMSSSDKNFDKTRNQLVQMLTEQIELYRQLELVDKEYIKNHSKNDSLLAFNQIDPKEKIGEAKSTIETFVNDTKKQLQDISTSTKTTKDGINIPIKLPSQVELVKTINKYVKSINDSDAIHGVRLKLDSGWLNDTANVIEDKTTRAYGSTPADYDKNTTDLVKKTENRFTQIANAINSKLNGPNGIVENTKKWRTQMLDLLKFDKEAFSFKFDTNLIQQLETLFEDYELPIRIDTEGLANQIKTVLEGSNVSLGGGTAVIDPSAIASAVMSGIRAALVGEPIAVNTPTNSAQDMIPEETDKVATEIEQTAKHLDIAEEYVQDVVKKIKEVARYATKYIGTEKDSKGAKATRELFSQLGGVTKDENDRPVPILDLATINQTEDGAAIAKMLEQAFLKDGQLGKLTGSTVIDAVSNFKGSTSKTIPSFIDSLREVFYMLQEDTETIEEWNRKKDSKEIFDWARGRAKAATALRDVRSPIRQEKIPSFESIDKAIALMTSIGRKTDGLESLKAAREKLGDKTDGASVKEFQDVASEFYKSSTKVFYDLKKQAEDMFKGTVYMQGSKKGVIKRQNVDNYKQLAKIDDNAVLLDIRVTSSMNNVALGEVGSKYDNRPSLREEQRLMRGQRADYLVSPEYEKDILNREINYEGFKPQGVGSTKINIEASINSLKQRIAETIDTIPKLQDQIDALNQDVQIKFQEAQKAREFSKSVRDNPNSTDSDKTEARRAEINAESVYLEALNKQKALMAQIEGLEKSKSRSGNLLQQLELTKQYNDRLTEVARLEGSIIKMEKDGAPQEELQNRKLELAGIRTQLTDIVSKAEEFGGLYQQSAGKEYSAAERKIYALQQLALIEDDLITARAQKNVVSSRIKKKDSEIAEVDRWGLGAGIGASVLNQEKYKATSEFMNGEYIRTLQEALRAQAKTSIAAAEQYAREVFNEKVSDAMIKDGMNPFDNKQVSQFLETERGQQYSRDFASKVDIDTKEIWTQYDTRIKTIRDQALAEFKKSMQVKDGVLSYVSKVKDENGKWVNEIVEVAVRDALRERLIAAKEILEKQQTPIQANVTRLEADKKSAIEYGGVGEKEMLSGDIIADQIRKEEKLEELLAKRASKMQEIVDLEQAGVPDSDASVKRANKEKERLDQEIAQYEMLIRNRKKLVDMRYDESKESTYTDKEKELHFTNQIVGYNQKIEDSLARQAELRRKIETASEEEKAKLQYALTQEEEKVAGWRGKVSKFESKLQSVGDAKSEVASTKTGEIAGGLLGLIKEAIGEASSVGSGGVSDEILSVIAETVAKILEVITSGGVKISAVSDVTKKGGAKDVALEKKLSRIRVLEAERTASTNKSTWTSAMSEEERKASIDTVNKYDKDAVAKWKSMGADELVKVMQDITKSMDGLNKESVEYLTKQRELGRVLNVYKEKSPIKDSATVTKKNGKSYIHPKMLAEKDDALKQLGLYDKYNPITSDLAIRNMFATPKDGGFTKKKEEELARLKKEIKAVNDAAKNNSGLKDAIPDEVSEETDVLIAKIERLKQKFEEAKRVGYLDANDADLKAFESATDNNEALRYGDKVSVKVARNRRAYSGMTEITAATRQRANMEARDILDHTDLQIVQDYNAAYDALMAKHKDFAVAGTLYDPENQKTLQNMAIKVKDLGKQLEKSVAESEQLKELVNNSGFYNGKQMSGYHTLSVEETQHLEASMKSYLQSLNLGNIEHMKFDHTHQKLTGTLRTSNKTVADLEVKYNEATGALYAYQKAERESLTGVPAFISGFKKKFNSIMQYLSMTMSIYRVTAELRKGVQYVREIDLALTELKKVTDETEEEYDQFLETAAKTGERLGSTISAVTEATATFAKLGYSMEQATEMAESAIVYKNVGDNIASTEDAADSIISTLKGFKMEASESMEIVDRFNEVGNRFAITSQGIGEALRLSASALSEGGNSLDESIALITAANEVVNDPSSVGKNKLADIKSGYISQNPEVDKT